MWSSIYLMYIKCGYPILDCVIEQKNINGYKKIMNLEKHHLWVLLGAKCSILHIEQK